MTPAMSSDLKQLAIRVAEDSDAESIARLACTLGYAATAEAIGSRLRAVRGSENDLTLVALNDAGAVIGWIQAHASHVIESGFRVEIAGLIVSTDVRRSGVGRALVSRAEEWARKLGAEAIVVRSNVQRVESHAFYPALGYSVTKTQTVYRKQLTKAPDVAQIS
jgi:predicted N-acetyltransferase YhbS